MIFDFEPGDKVFNPANKDWGIGQVQYSENIELKKINDFFVSFNQFF